MKPIRSALVLALTVLALPARAQSDADAQGVIEAQIDAFRIGDFDTAFGFASDNIRRLFGTTATFADMVRQGYPMVIDPESLLFLERADRDGVTVQRVLMTDDAGQSFLLEYRLIREGEALRINGVRILPQAGAGV